MAADARERAFATLVRHAAARDNEPYLLGIAEGLARSKDPRAVEWLEKLSSRRTSLDARQAAQRGLAVGYRDEGAIKALRRELSGKDEELELRAAQVLYELADEEAFEWAVDVITQRRTADAGGADVRGQVVRDLVELGGEPSRQALRAALDDGSRNEWIEAWIAVGLLELGDERTAGFRRTAKGCGKCGFGFLFELMDDYYPAPNAAFFVCDQQGRLIGCGRGTRELTGLSEERVIGRPVNEVLGLKFDGRRRPGGHGVGVGGAGAREAGGGQRRGRHPGARHRRPVPRLRRRRRAAGRAHADRLSRR